jgi:hypothetical protein
MEIDQSSEANMQLVQDSPTPPVETIGLMKEKRQPLID